jgi:drug/metabolite transporter (DMT)-like permease
MTIQPASQCRPRLAARELTGHVAEILSVAAFAIGIIVQKDLARQIPAADVVALQLALATGPMWLICAVAGALPHRISEAVPGLLWGCITPGLVFLLASAGAARTDGVSVALIWGVTPLIVPFLGRLFLDERFHWTMPAGATVAFAGLLLLTFNRQTIGVGHLGGNLLVAAGMLAAAFGQIAGRRLNTSGAPWFRIATLQVTGAALIASAVALSDGRWEAPAVDDTAAMAQLAFLVFGMTMANFIGYNLALSRIPVAWISLYSSLNPAIGTAAAVVLLAALVRPIDIAGIAVVMGGVALPHVWRIARRSR